MALQFLSLCTTPIWMLKGETPVAFGTGFFYVQEGIQEIDRFVSLVTNRHVLTDKGAPEAGQPVPDGIGFQIHLSEEKPSEVQSFRLPLFTDDGRPAWVESSVCPEADLAVMPVPPWVFEHVTALCVSEETTQLDLDIKPTTTVALVGYPRGFYDRLNALPIWKTGCIASEPEVDFNGKPVFLVDVAAFAGMSGSPVVTLCEVTFQTDQGPVTVGGIRKLIGIFASSVVTDQRVHVKRVTDDAEFGLILPESMEIGYVWKARLIVDTIRGININQHRENIWRHL